MKEQFITALSLPILPKNFRLAILKCSPLLLKPGFMLFSQSKLSMSRYRDSGSDCKVYVGDLGSSASKQDLEDAFGYYGPLKNVWVARHPPGFAFVEFEDPRDADDAVRGLDGRSIAGRRVRVEPSNGVSRRRGRDRGPSRRGRPFHPDDRCYQCGERGHYARDCKRYRRGGRSRRSRSFSRSRSRDRRSRSRSNSKSRSRSKSRDKKSKSSDRRSKSNEKRSLSKSSSKSRSRSRSGSEDKPNGIKNDDE